MQYTRTLTAIIGTLIAVILTLNAVIHVICTLTPPCAPVHAVYPLLVPVAAAVGSAVLGVPARASGLRE